MQFDIIVRTVGGIKIIAMIAIGVPCPPAIGPVVIKAIRISIVSKITKLSHGAMYLSRSAYLLLV